ncbi:MAG: NADH-quinone oxidoreductase subunit J [Campylobacterales bacterium]|nr:NADH-quinone oxidoreductase subunit J [Campylobacterales bacterium]
MFEQIAFYFFSAATVVLFLITAFSKNVLYAMSALAAGMVMISGFFFLLDADFLGAVQLIVYVGAVMALYAFGMMFFDATKDVKEKNAPSYLVVLLGGLSALLLVVMFAAPILGSNIEASYPPIEGISNPKSVGLVLFTKYLIPFEVAALMLLVAMIAGIILAGKKMDISLTDIEEDIAISEEEEMSLDEKDGEK